MKFTVEGSFSVDVSIEIEADNAESAIEAAKTHFKDSYHLDTYGYHHNPDQGVFFGLESFEEDEE